MILGVLDRRRGATVAHDPPHEARPSEPGSVALPAPVFASECLTVWVIPASGHLTEPRASVADHGQVALVLEGRIYDTGEARPADRPQVSGAEALVSLHEKDPERFLDRVNGTFAFALWDDRRKRLVLGRDRLGAEPLFYIDDGRRLIFASSLRWLLASGWLRRDLDPDVLLQYLLYGYNPGASPIVRGVRTLPPAHVLTVDVGETKLTRYWRLSFAEVRHRSEEEYRHEVLDLIEDAIRIRLSAAGPPGIFLSGGTDSSAIVSLASRMVSAPLATFSFRCEGRSYDESSYARFVADRYGTRHTEIDFHPGRLEAVHQAVEWMDEPFSDAGIEIATFLLGEAAAQGQIGWILSGEGGDELFAGHPVYVADKVAAVVDRFPRALVHAASRTLQSIPDSDQKKDLRVKIKRFAYSLAFPPALLSHRWRVLYTLDELRALCTGDLLERCNLGARWDRMLEINAAADGRDRLSRSLYSDYHTLVAFYLKRLGLLRAFSLENGTPLFDHRLVEYAATIPSNLKIRGLSETKYLYKRILRGVVPDEILHGRPKLGHGVPLKNWLRQDSRALSLLHDVLGGKAFLERGLFRKEAVAQLLDEHARKLHNHSHRLWALVVLERWLERWLDE